MSDDYEEIGIMMALMIALMMLSWFQQGPAVDGTANLSGYVRDTEGNPTSGAQVTINGFVNTSDVNGAYGFAGLTPGDYTVGVNNAEALGYEPKSPIPIHLNAGDNSLDIILTPVAIPGKANLSGVVEDSETGLPVDGVNLILNGNTATTSLLGIYSFENVNPGDYTLTASKGGYVNKSIDLTLKEGDNIKDLIIDPVGAEVRDIDGYITNEDTGEPISGALAQTSGKSAYSSGDGYYRLYSLDLTTHMVIYSKDGYETKVDAVELTAGTGPLRHDVELSPSIIPQAKFEIADLLIEPAEVNVGEVVEISALVTNTGDAAGVCVVTCDVTPDTYTPLEIAVLEIPWTDILNAVVGAVMIVVFVGVAIKIMRRL